MENDCIKKEIKEYLIKMLNDWRSQGLSESEIEEKINSKDFSEKMEELFYLNEIFTESEKIINDFKENMYEMYLDEQEETYRFLSHHTSIWGNCFVFSYAMYCIAVQSAEVYSQFIEENMKKIEDKKNTYLVLKHIHGRACQEFLEILYLMKLGFADCAFARCRSIYELSCCASFIFQQGEDIATQYLEHAQKTDTSKNTSYAWAIGSKNRQGKQLKKWYFHDIEEYCQKAENWKKQYNMSCNIIHSSPKATFGRLGNSGKNNCILIGHSCYGIAEPADVSAICLYEVTDTYLSIFPTYESMINRKVLHDWVGMIRDSYFKVKKERFEQRGEKEGKQSDE